MKILGFNYTKINVEKNKELSKDLKISNKIDVLGISEVKQDVLKSKDEVLAVKFSYSIEYSPGIASVNLEGTIMLSTDSEMAKDVMKKWKNRETPEEFRIPLFNIIFRKAGLKALELEDEMNLPLHMSMPTLRRDDKSSK